MVAPYMLVPEVLGFLRCQVQGGQDGNEAGIGHS